jgi:hypothetical protein
MIPKRLEAYQNVCPTLEEVTNWQLLRKWSLSEVYRATMKSGATRIVKWGGDEMAREKDIYRNLLAPLQIRSPQLYEYHAAGNGAPMIMEDAGPYNLEEQPEAHHFLEAAWELARLRQTASIRLKQGHLPKKLIDTYLISDQDFLSLLDDLIRVKDDPIFQRTKISLPKHLERLYKDVPLTLVHHDFHAKNLIVLDNGILPIDWSITYLSPHLGDLFCLMHEAHYWSGLEQDEVILAFQREVGPNQLNIEDLKWQVNIGGLCWLIKSLRWLVYGGTETIPVSVDWIPDLMTDMSKILESLEEG